MKKANKNKNKTIINALGKGVREAYLEQNIGFVSVHKVHTSKKSYTRKGKNAKYNF